MFNKIFHYISEVFKPQLFMIPYQGYSWIALTKDLLAGIIVGIVALPLAIAFGIASLGPTPDAVQRGLFTAIIAGFIVSCLSGSKVQIGGPTGAFIVIIFGIISNPEMGIDGLLCATIL
ncbi:MAG: SulP family inorganic anion transporter, partial [Thermoguttaceae bacterium]